MVASGAMDWRAVAFLAALAFLLASFPARNSDLWMHLANGRSFVESGSFQRSWLFNLGAYLAHTLVGGTGLALLKALFAMALAILLARLGWAGGGWGWVVAATTLALLAMSPRLLLQSSLASYVLLAFASWLARPSDQESSQTIDWPLLILFLVWPQIDGGFVLGLAFLACSWLGRGIDGADRSPGRTFTTFVVLAGVCMLNPLHIRGFLTIPPGRSLIALAKAAEQGFRPDLVAYLALLLLGVLSFVLNHRGWRWQRFLPWVTFATLSALNDRLIPYFAIVASPTLALNMQEFVIRGEPRRDWGLGRPFAVLVGLGLLISAWPGWLQAPPYQPRRWAVEAPTAPEYAARVLAGWYRDGKLPPDSRGLHLSADTANVFAWFCPRDQALHDPMVSAALLGEEDAPEGWQDRLRDAGVTHVVLYEPDKGRLGAALERLGADPARWPLLLVKGDVAVFGWRPPGLATAEDPLARLAFDQDRLAYRPAPDRRAPREPPETVARSWWEAFWEPAAERPIDRDEATVYLLQAEVARRSALGRHLFAWEAAMSAGLVGSAVSDSPASAVLNAFARLHFARPRSPRDGAKVEGLPIFDRLGLWVRQGVIVQQDDTPPALLYLAIRAGRRAVAANPGDAVAHLILGECYIGLLASTRERVWAARFPELLDLRRTQASAAFNQAARLRPGLAQAHRSLADLYMGMGYLDLALEHRQKLDKLIPTPTPGVADLAADVDKRTKAFEKEAGDARVLDRATAAAAHGLAGKARDILLKSDVAAFGARGMALELELLLKTGRLKEVRGWMEPDQRQALGSTTYHWLRTQALAASGDYLGADSDLKSLADSLVPDDKGGQAMNARQLVATLVGQAVLDEQPGLGSLPHLLARARGRSEFLSRVNSLERGLKQQANVSVIRGLLALEEGNSTRAVAAFQSAKQMWKDPAAARSGAGLDFSGREAARVWLERLE